MNGTGFTRREERWSPAEKKIARKAFDGAHRRQCAAIAAKAKQMLAAATTPSELWQVHDYLSEQRKIADKTFDYRYSVLPIVFAGSIRHGWLTPAELAGLHKSKIERIKLLTAL